MRNPKEQEKMSDAKKRKFHTPEFKAKVALEALRGVRTINEIGQEFGVHPITVGHWRKELQEQAKTLFETIRDTPRFSLVAALRTLVLGIGKNRDTPRFLIISMGSVPIYIIRGLSHDELKEVPFR
jgi:hypothetical protein